MTPEAQRVRARLDELNREQQYYFFGRVRNPKAFEVFAEAGAFDGVTPPEIENGQELHYSWPPTFYLRNVVADIPDRISNLVRAIETRNIRVISDLVELVERMPSNEQESLLETLCTWLDGPHTPWIWSSYVTIVRQLAEAERISAAMSLSRRIIRVVRKEASIKGVPRYRSRDAVAEIGDDSYDHVLSQIVDAFTPRHVGEAATLLGETLDEALKLEAKAKTDSDYSNIWARRLNKHPIGYGAKEALTYHLFETLRKAVEKRTFRLELALALLGRWARWPIFKRIRLALVDAFGSTAERRAEILGRGFMTLREADFERAALLSHTYHELDIKSQDQVWSAIQKALPKEAKLRESFAVDTPLDKLDDQVARYRRRQLFQRLTPIGRALTGERAELYASLETESPPDPYEHTSGDVWVGPESPIDADSLSTMPISNLFQYVEEWRSPKRFMAPSYLGLGRNLGLVAEQRWRDFLASVDRIMQWPPIYVSHVIDALRKHVAEVDFDISAFVRLLQYTRIQRPANAGGRFAIWNDYDEDEPGDPWSALGTITAFAVTDLLRASSLPKDQRETLWNILTDLLRDADPTIEDDARRGGSEPWNYALNSVRGAAMLAAFDFARWLYRMHGGDVSPPNMLSLAPELFDELELHLDASFDSSPAVRACYGQNFVSIFALSREWTVSQIPRIFGNHDVTGAAWTSYLALNGVYDEIYGYLSSYYYAAVKGLKTADFDDDSAAARGLAAHVMRLFARDMTELEQPEGIIRQFLVLAPSEVLGAAIQSAGSSLSAPGITDEIWSRLRTLYEATLTLVTDRPVEDRRKSLEPFGLWLFSPTLDAGWGLQALIRTLRLTQGRIAVEARVLEWLSNASVSDPLNAVTALYELIAHSRVGFYPDGSIRTILRNAVVSRGEALAMAHRVDERLASVGVHKFRDTFDLQSHIESSADKRIDT